LNQTKGLISERRKSHRSIKNAFRRFFEGFDDLYSGYHHDMEPIIDIPISKFGICDIQFDESNSEVIMYITLERPGILIGSRGYVIDKLQEYLSECYDKRVKISIIESKLWR